MSDLVVLCLRTSRYASANTYTSVWVSRHAFQTPQKSGSSVISDGLFIVPAASADPEFGTPVIPVPTDHIHVCKPCGKDDLQYTMTVKFIEDCIVKTKLERALKSAISAIELGMELAEGEERSEGESEKKERASAHNEDVFIEMILTCCG